MSDEPRPQDVAEPESWTPIEGAANTSEAALIAGFLEAHEIPARVVDRSFHQTPTTGEDLSPIAVAVPTDRAEEARRVLERREREFAARPAGSDEILTDEGPADVDPSTKD